MSRNVGTTISRNIGLHNIDPDADYICILDSDAYITQDAISSMISCLISDIRLGLVGPQMVSPLGSVQLTGRNFPTARIKILKGIPIKRFQKAGESLETPKYRKIGNIYPVDYLLSACWLMRPDVLRNIGFLDEKIFYAPEDVDYCMRIWKNGYIVGLCENARIIHEYQRISKKRIFSRMNIKHFKGLIYFFIKYRYLCSPPKSYTAENYISVLENDRSSKIANYH